MNKRVIEVNVDDLGFGGVFSLIKNVIQHKSLNMKIDIAAIEMFQEEENVELLNSLGSKVYYIGCGGNKIIKQIICFNNLRRLLKREDYDCVHIHADVANKLLISGLAAKSCKIKKIILHSHASGIDGNFRTIKRVIHYGCRRILKYIGTDFIACSDVAANWMFPNIKDKSIKIIKNGINLDTFRFDKDIRNHIRDELNISDKFIIGHVGRFAYQKNHTFLVDIFSEVKKVIPNAVLLLVGEGPLEQEVKSQVRQKNLENDVIFYGTSNKVHELFNAMDVFLLPSHFEGLPIVGVEAQSSGLPVIFSDKITREAKLTESVVYLSIDGKTISTWVKQIEMFYLKERYDTYQELKEKSFSIQDTIQCLLKLYKC